MWELDYKESWAQNWCFWTVILEKTLESPLDCKEIKPVSPKGNQSWISLEGLMLKLKLQYVGHLMWRTNSFEKTLRLGKIEDKRRRGTQRMRWLDGITDHWTWTWANSSKGQGSLTCCSPRGCKELDTTKWQNNSNDMYISVLFPTSGWQRCRKMLGKLWEPCVEEGKTAALLDYYVSKV